MPVIYNSCSIIPAPLITIQDNPILGGNQRRLGNTYRISMNSYILPDMGSPQQGSLSGPNWGGPSNLFWTGSAYPPNEQVLLAHKLGAVETKIQALKTLFATEGQWLEFTAPDGTTPLKCQPKNIILSFPEEGIWVQDCRYQILCETDILYMNGEIYQGLPFPELIQNADERWDIKESAAIRTFDVSHSVSAIGKRTFNNVGGETYNPFEVAKQFVLNRLTLGWNGTSVLSNTTGPYIFNNSSLASGSVDFNSLSPYNFSRVENIDEVAGSYGVIETWVLAQGSGYEIYNININKISNDPYTTVHAAIQGTIKGFYINLFDYNTRMLAAEYVWSQLGVSGLYNRITSFINTPQVILNPQAIVGTLDYNPNEGTITYHYEYDNRLLGATNNAYEIYTITRATNAESYKSTFTIAGQVIGLRYDGDYDQTAAFQRASALWNTISPNNGIALYNRIISSTYFPEASGIGLQFLPVVKDIQMNQSAGTINYSYIFDNRAEAVSIDGFSTENILDEYTCSRHYSRAEAIITYTIAGTVKGLNVIDTSNPYLAKYALASGYFYGYAYPNLYSRISSYYGVNLPWTVSQVEEIQHDPHLGQISYSVQFNNLYPPILPNVLSEVIRVSEQNREQNIQVTAKIPIPGRTKGPIVQNILTTVVKTRTLDIETVIPTFGSTSIYDSWQNMPNYDSAVVGMVPAGGYVENDQYTYDWRLGRYTRQVVWVYE